MMRATILIALAATACMMPHVAFAEDQLDTLGMDTDLEEMGADRSLLAKASASASSGAKAKGTGKGVSKDSGASFGSGSSTKVNAGACFSTASSKKFSFSVNSFISTFAKAIAGVCKGGSAGKFKADVKKGVAAAFAGAVADSSIICDSKGKAVACGKAASKAKAWAKGKGGAFAGAISKSIVGCGCANAKGFASAFAKTFATVIAKASAFSKSKACVKGDQSISVNAYTSCFAESIAHLTSVSVSSAFARGNCKSAFVSAFASAFTKKQVTVDASCASKTVVKGSGKGKGKTGGSADAVST